MVHINYTQCLQYLVLGCVTSRPKTINIVAVFFPNNYKIEKCVFFFWLADFICIKTVQVKAQLRRRLFKHTRICRRLLSERCSLPVFPLSVCV